ncbi:peptide chain release factor N(5)-glutamine methyltransferase [Patescibacteria group bacterium]|nr:peptide chain release factor N(5)-glutamine methyltransferase [Patescibacteria group bacterium]MCL5409709.1 peptide chain release factor N(5)-glutamine methyltransferase [Patescibacteria group bacterium]
MISQKLTPLAYQRGWIEFYKLKFLVNRQVLIPRPETEGLTERVLNFISQQSNPVTVVDLGTGSGCIAIAMAKNTPTGTTIYATDNHITALKIAAKNLQFHQLDKQIHLIKSDLFANSKFTSRLKNSQLIIVANLPYVPSARIPQLDPSVKDFEPLSALDGGKDGFVIYRQLFTQIKQLDLKPLAIFCEIDDTQPQIAQQESTTCFPQAKIKIEKDLYGRWRYLEIVNR